jgi:hypothetical protein
MNIWSKRGQKLAFRRLCSICKKHGLECFRVDDLWVQISMNNEGVFRSMGLVEWDFLEDWIVEQRNQLLVKEIQAS